MSNPDVSLGDSNPAATPDGQAGHDHGDTVFGNPNGPANGTQSPKIKQLSLDEVLTSAKRRRTIAKICMRADLQAAYDEKLAELGTLVDREGKLLRSAEESLGETNAAARAQELDAGMVDLRREMNEAMRSVEFEGMPEDKWRPWYNQNFPHQKVKTAASKGEEPDISAFNDLLIAETAVGPTFTVDEVKQLRSVLTAPQMTLLANQAWKACTEGGVDIPKSRTF